MTWRCAVSGNFSTSGEPVKSFSLPEAVVLLLGSQAGDRRAWRLCTEGI